jgi:hypothetical protein
VRRHLKDRVAVALAAAVVLLVLVEAFLIPHYEPVFPWHRVPGYSAAIGLFGAIMVVQISKWLGKVFLQEPEGEDG